jgi:hypothetical protein
MIGPGDTTTTLKLVQVIEGLGSAIVGEKDADNEPKFCSRHFFITDAGYEFVAI